MPSKFVTINTDNVKTEESVYTVDEFASTGPQADSPVVTQGDGKISPTLLPDSSASESAKLLKISRVATTDVSALELVKADSATHSSVATSDSTFEDAQVLGLALTGATAGNSFEILLLGASSDGSFAFSLNAPLYLGIDGAITSTSPTSGHRVLIGKSLGVGQIFIEVTEPIILI